MPRVSSTLFESVRLDAVDVGELQLVGRRAVRGRRHDGCGHARYAGGVDVAGDGLQRIGGEVYGHVLRSAVRPRYLDGAASGAR